MEHTNQYGSAASPFLFSSDSSDGSTGYLQDVLVEFGIKRRRLMLVDGPCYDDREDESRVAYPFAVVKPGGTEGEVTLKDINRRIMKPLTRTVRHPVGEFACRPRQISGKVVVGLTRIQTTGRGTITIIRTKG